MTKAEVRELAKYLGLPTWDKPALACLSSRFPYGQEITPEKLSQVARAEEFLRREDFKQVRVRHHGEIARLGVGPDELERAFAMREKISAELLDAGFLYVTLDLAGYRSGSLERGAKERQEDPAPHLALEHGQRRRPAARPHHSLDGRWPLGSVVPGLPGVTLIFLSALSTPSSRTFRPSGPWSS